MKGVDTWRYVYILAFMSDEGRAAPDNAANFATMCVCFNIRKAARAVSSLYDTELRPTGLRSTQAMLLMALATAPHAPTITRLAEAMVMDRTTVARELKPLADQGLVYIVPGADRRTREVRLTDAGEEKRREIIPYWERVQAKLVGTGLGYARWDKLQNELQDVVRLAQK